ncbi:ribonuclease PH [Pelagibacterium flavum]|uniref:Ribonuclease PH n=1 Tax=Pelagibacterium flavum TaxID=2984530 RepID=A0ABY6INU1_9HYPH|nr:ribonuclease PH [Pelagibacterium sp. YIM 151497]UYQ72288.1 ribonuclease PH [Pelagibacterium sp. YIM 151497]
MRPSGRASDQIRDVTIERGVAPQAEGSCLVSFGRTRVLCTASVETSLPPWRRGQGLGWVTAEYGMLPRATGSRTRREATAGKQSGRTQEIQRLIGRSLRAVIDMQALGENQVILDCDVLEADGGTRTASITGAFVALSEAIFWMKERSLLKGDPIRDHVAAVSCGVYRGTPVLDLDYLEDSEADTDANFVLTGSGKFVEIQGTAEAEPFSAQELAELIGLAEKGIAELVDLQRAVLGAS